MGNSPSQARKYDQSKVYRQGTHIPVKKSEVVKNEDLETRTDKSRVSSYRPFVDFDLEHIVNCCGPDTKYQFKCEQAINMSRKISELKCQPKNEEWLKRQLEWQNVLLENSRTQCSELKSRVHYLETQIKDYDNLHEKFENAKHQISGQTKKIHQLINENTTYADQVEKRFEKLNGEITYHVNQIETLKKQIAAAAKDGTQKKDSQVKPKKKRANKKKKKNEKTTLCNESQKVSATKPLPEDSDDDIFECTVCGLEQSVQNRILFIPCSHGSCHKCGNQLTHCPICGMHIHEVSKQF